jgi:hypothetical protein
VGGNFASFCEKETDHGGNLTDIVDASAHLEKKRKDPE